ncbi:LysR family transcriptional regulator [Oceanospirillum sediminis]|uniref:LysR family transcriptional regulator n=1 Tax=Oceanospirillum sediminis TaxID=2760088 RepID=A0A839IR62_9GAMM|nr:LysR family transcriptional regulator [Oceanospirillum sediminis]MBB1487190.1 LysR family transcriptional regulator [Oceanospirillum sediminis]
MPDHISLTAIRTLAIVAHELSFSRAAEQLHISPSAVSHQMKQLEQQLGYALFVRHSQGVELTQAGRELARYARQAMQQVDTGLKKARQQSQKTTLTLAVTPSLAQSWLIPRLNSFYQIAPDTELKLLARDALTDFNQQDTDLHLHFGDGQAVGLRSEFLMAESMVAVCHHRLISPSEDSSNQSDALSLRQRLEKGEIPLLHYQAGEEDAPGGLSWQDWFSRNNLTMASDQPHYHFSHLQMVLEAARCQQGIALVWENLLTPADTALIRLPFDPIALKYGHYLVAPEHHWQRDDIKQFSQWLKSQA